METIKDFEQLIDHLRVRGIRSRVAVVWAADENTLMSVNRALEAGFIDALFVGCEDYIKANPVVMRHADHISFVHAEDSDDAARRAVELVRQHEADILMKGMLNTDNLLRAVLNRDHGMLPAGKVLTHITACSVPRYGKLLFFSDPAVIPFPNDEQRHAQVGYLAYAAHAFGIEEPKIALLHCSEKVDERHFPYTAHYKTLIEEANRGDFGKVIVDGPLDLKTACSKAALAKKHIDSPIEGQADCLLFPDIEAANMFYKVVTLFADAAIAGVLQGTMAPVVLPSRGDTIISKFYSLALAAL